MERLNHPLDLAAWQRGQRATLPLGRRARGALASLRRRPPTVEVATRAGDAGPAGVLVVLDALTATSRLALLEPARMLPAEGTVVVGPPGLGAHLRQEDWRVTHEPAVSALRRLLGDRTVVLSTGHYLELGSLAHDVAAEHGARFVTVQHGLLTPHAPPLAPRTTLLAWSEADATFWTAGRDDVPATVVGSQLLWEAAEHPVADVDPRATPVFLGQLHGAELPRRDLTEAAEGFCRSTGATYRPHPSETDRRSRATHRRWERSGIRVDRSATPLRELAAPVVSVFSTGVLEAAAAGMPAWVHLPEPPRWVAEFWSRYRLATWGEAPTASPERPPVAPSHAVAEVVRGMMAG